MKTITLYIAILFVVFPLFLTSQSSWTRVTPLPQENTLNQIIQIPGTNRMIAVGEGSTVMISDNNGTNWNIYLNPAGKNNDHNCKGVYFINENTGFIYGGKETILKTTDSGINWNLVYSGSSSNNWQCVNEIEFISETDGYAIADEGQLLKSSNIGESWELIETGVDFDLKVLEFQSAVSGFIFGSSDEYLRTTDGGESWSVESLPASINGLNFKDVYFTTPSTGIAIGTKYIQGSSLGQIFKTDDGGNSWLEVYSDENGWYWPEAIDFYDENNGMVSFNTIMYGCINYITNDGGDTWEETPMFYFSWEPCRTLYYEEDRAIIAGNMGMIAHLEDQGISWDFYSERTFYGEISDAQYIGQQIGYASVVNGSGGAAIHNIFKTIDGGDNWTIGTSLLNSFVFHFVNETIGYIALHDIDLSVYKTISGGQDWTITELEDYEFNPSCIRFYDELKGIICGDNQILVTSDGGVNWAEVYDDSFTNSYRDIEFRNEDEAFICGEDCTSTFVIKSEDGGYSWDYQYVTNHIDVEDIYFYNENTVFLVGYDAILKSTDGGESFIETTISNQNEIFFYSIYFPSEEIGFAVGHGQYETIVKSTNGGETWNVINSNSTSDLNAVHFFDENIGLVFGDKGVVLKTTTGGITGIEEVLGHPAISVFNAFPNPFNNEINIDLNSLDYWSDGLIMIYDQSGKHIQDYEFSSLSGNLKIETGKLNSGVYFIQLITDNKLSETKKIIKL